MVNFKENKEKLIFSNDSRVHSGSNTRRKRHIPHALRTPEYVKHRNDRERRRVEAINKAFCDLEKHVPFLSEEERNSKVDILNAAAYYIRNLSELLLQSTAAQRHANVYRGHFNRYRSSRQSEVNGNFQNEENTFVTHLSTNIDNEFNFSYNRLRNIQPTIPYVTGTTVSVTNQHHQQNLNMNRLYGLPQLADNGGYHPLQTNETSHCSTNADSGPRCILYADSGPQCITYNVQACNQRDGNRTPLRNHWSQNQSDLNDNTNNMMKCKHSTYMEICEPRVTTNSVNVMDNQQLTRAGISSHDVTRSGYNDNGCIYNSSPQVQYVYFQNCK